MLPSDSPPSGGATQEDSVGGAGNSDFSSRFPLRPLEATKPKNPLVPPSGLHRRTPWGGLPLIPGPPWASKWLLFRPKWVEIVTFSSKMPDSSAHFACPQLNPWGGSRGDHS